ncbi:MAG: hypothetical protein KIT17_05725 [Rubrivivax sp.]|nr:hypothetical protein [Rubrivivax sp.]
MKTTLTAALLAAVAAAPALAHPGHGAPPLHLHEAEWFGLVALGALAAAVAGGLAWLWLRGRR